MSIEDGRKRLEDIAQRLRSRRDAGKTPRVRRTTVQNFLRWFGYTRRGNYIVEQIRQCLEENQLRTVPDFEGAWYYGKIAFEIDSTANAASAPKHDIPDPTIRIDSIAAAHAEPYLLDPNEKVRKALSIMQMDSISHVIVSGDGRAPMGVVSWKSIADFLAGKSENLDAPIRDCMEPFDQLPIMSRNDPLFAATEQVLKTGFVLVRGDAGKIGGIVTERDLAEKFERLALPYQMIGEIEGYLRRRIHSRLTQIQIDEAVLHAGGPAAEGSHGLTFADYITIVGNENTWKLLGFEKVNRDVLIDHLEWLRVLRNDIMHFSVDEPKASDLSKLKKLVDYFRRRFR